MIQSPMANKYLKYFFLILLFHFSNVLPAQVTDDFPPKPAGQTLVNNLSTSAQDILSAQEIQMLETKLRAFSDSTSNQIAIIIVDETKGYDPNEYASRIGEKWGIGKGDKDNGVVVLVVNPYKNPEFGPRSLTIQVGYGLEEVIPDLATKQIRENEINPYFKNKNFYEGLNRGTDVLMNLAIGKYKVQDYVKRRGDSPSKILLVIIIIIIIIIFLSRGGGRGTTYSSRGIFWGGMTGLGGGGWNSGGSSDSGGSSWGGFGGGSFGGGGSSGDW
jgi:uncharacterized protein